MGWKIIEQRDPEVDYEVELQGSCDYCGASTVRIGAANGLVNKYHATLAITHADQIPVSARMMLESPKYISYGETAEDVKEL